MILVCIAKELCDVADEYTAIPSKPSDDSGETR